MKNINLALFEWKQIRRVWDNEQEKWFFSIVDVIKAITLTDRERKYWSDL